MPQGFYSLITTATAVLDRAASARSPGERLRLVGHAERLTLQALACVHGPAGVAAPRAPSLDRSDRIAVLP